MHDISPLTLIFPLLLLLSLILLLLLSLILILFTYNDYSVIHPSIPLFIYPFRIRITLACREKCTGETNGKTEWRNAEGTAQQRSGRSRDEESHPGNFNFNLDANFNFNSELDLLSSPLSQLLYRGHMTQWNVGIAWAIISSTTKESKMCILRYQCILFLFLIHFDY